MSTPITVLLTGATGHLGVAIAAAMLTDTSTYQLRVLSRSETKMGQLIASDARLSGLRNVQRVIGDIRDQPILDKALRGVDVVIHACHSHEYWKGAQYLYDVNVGGTRALTAALSRTGSVRKVVFIGSYSAHQMQKADFSVGSLSGYSARECSTISKPIAQQLLVDSAQDLGFALHIVSPGYMIGPYQLDPTYFGALFHMVQFGPLRWCPPNSINIVDVRDVAKAVTECLQSEDATSRVLATGDNTPMQQLFTEMNRQVGSTVVPTPIPCYLFRLTPNLKQFGKFGKRYFTENHISISGSDLSNREFDLSSSVRDGLMWAKRQKLFRSRGEVLKWMLKRYLR